MRRDLDPAPFATSGFFLNFIFDYSSYTKHFTVYIGLFSENGYLYIPYDTISKYRLYYIAWKRAIHRHLECN